MGYNKVVYGGKVLVDLTSDTVVASALKKGYTAHDKSGAVITGTLEEAQILTGKTVPASSLGNNGPNGRSLYFDTTLAIQVQIF